MDKSQQEKRRALEGLDHSMPRDGNDDIDTTLAQNTDGTRGIETDPEETHDDSGPDVSNASEIGANDGEDAEPVGGGDTER